MALNRSSANRFSTSIWPGYVDALATLLLVLIFVLTVTLVVQSVLRDQITHQGDTISQQERRLDALGQQISALGAALEASQERESDLSQRAEAAEHTLAITRGELDARAEEARLAAARAEALEALSEDLRRRNSEAASESARLQQALDESEAARLSDAELQAALLAAAREELARQEQLSSEDQTRLAVLDHRVANLTAQLGTLQALLDNAGDEQKSAELRVADLGQQLNAALLLAAEEKNRRLAAEEDARRKAQEEARDLARYRSEFFGRLSQILSGREGVEVVGDRFVFQSEVLFPPGAATLSPAGREQIQGVARMLSDIADDIPAEIDWIIRVDGHTDRTPLSGAGRYRDNWELSQARALAVVRYMTQELGFPANRLAATGFGDTRPISPGDSPEALARNRRIELKLTER